MALAALYVGQTLHFVFESDDLRFLWWAQENANTPWVAFYDAPLFGQYYRPVISLVWWLHYRVFGPDDFCHQLMTGLWWMTAVGLLFQLLRVRISPLAGFASMLALLCMYAGVNPIVWKSWLTAICSVTFQLAALLALHSCLQRTSIIRVLVWLLLCGCAFLSKESAIVCLPLTSVAMASFESNRSLKIRFLFIIFMLTMASVAFYLAPNLQFFIRYGPTQVSFFQTWLPLASFFAGALWTSWYFLLIGFTLLLFSIANSRIAIIALLCFSGIGLVVGWLAYGQGIRAFECLSLALIFSYQSLWFHPNWKRFAAPLVWLAVSFFPLPAIGLRSIPYAFDASISLAWVLGLLAYHPVIDTLAFGFRRWKACLVSIVIIVMLPWMIYMNMGNMIGWKRYAESIYHGAERSARQAAAFDLASRAWEGPIYIDVGERLGLETFLAIVLPDDFHVPVQFGSPPEGAYRFEAYSESVYSIYPKTNAHDIWIASSNIPSSRVIDDPYFIPERWMTETISSCDAKDGWEQSEKLNVVGFPIGVGAHLQRTFTEEEWTFHFTKTDALLPGSKKWAVQFWLETRRWDWVKSVAVTINLNSKVYQWQNAPLERWGLASDWRRVSLSSEQAIELEDADDASLSIVIQVVPRNTLDSPLITIGVDEINLYSTKTE